MLAAHGKIVLPITQAGLSIPPTKALASLVLPLNLLIRWDHVLNSDIQKHLARLWDQLLVSDVSHRRTKDRNRSINPGFHFGIWELASAQPHLTSETVRQSPKAIKAIDALLRYLKDFVAPRITHLLKEDAPDQWKVLQRLVFSLIHHLW